MAGFNLARKMKRTKAEQLKLIENMNQDAIQQLAKQHIGLVQKFNEAGQQLMSFQKEIYSLKNALKRRGVITELDVSQERSAIEELERMQSQAVILGEGKKDERG